MQPAAGEAQSIRIHPVLRGADLSLMNSLGDAEVWYFNKHVDLPARKLLPEGCVQVSTFSAIRRIFSTRAHTIEIPEPLWARFLPRGLLLMVAARVARLATGTPRRSVFYALENNAPHRALFGGSRAPDTLLEVPQKALGLLVSLLIDSIAYGSQGARKTYEQIGTLRVSEEMLFTELPARPLEFDDQNRRRTNRALFVGGLEARKGVEQLLTAWEEVERADASAILTIVGDGPLGEVVQRWVEARPTTRRWLGRVDHTDLFSIYDAADVLVAPSVRDGRWREQIGLQLREALVRGLTLVVSDETGLARWLQENGHRVVPLANLQSMLPEAILDALHQPLGRGDVQRSLPVIDGRVAADSWLHRHGRP